MGIDSVLERLKRARVLAGLSQAQAAKLLDMDSSSTISHYESGLRTLSVETLLRLCEIYGASEVWVLSGVNPDFDPSPVFEAAERMRVATKDVDAILETLEIVSVRR